MRPIVRAVRVHRNGPIRVLLGASGVAADPGHWAKAAPGQFHRGDLWSSVSPRSSIARAKIGPMELDPPYRAISILNFGMRGVIADVNTHTKFSLIGSVVLI